jgi:hypothetical protein
MAALQIQPPPAADGQQQQPRYTPLLAPVVPMMMPYGMMPYTAGPMQFAAQLQPQLFLGPGSGQAAAAAVGLPLRPPPPPQQPAAPQQRGMNLFNMFQGWPRPHANIFLDMLTCLVFTERRASSMLLTAALSCKSGWKIL